MSDLPGRQTVTPYYSDDHVTIFHGDCLEVLPRLGTFDLIVTSPPYNLGRTPWDAEPLGHYVDGQDKGGGGQWVGSDGHGGVAYDDHDDAMPWQEYSDWQMRVLERLYFRHLNETGAIFYNHKPRPAGLTTWLPSNDFNTPEMPLRQVLIWLRQGGFNYSPTHYVPMHEWILIFARKAFRLASRGASGAGDVWSIPQDRDNPHPSPFPVGLPARAIETTGAVSVLDPFMGSGSTLVAAKAAGILGVGIEISERYCELAAQRCSQATLGLSFLPATAARSSVQTGMDDVA